MKAIMITAVLALVAMAAHAQRANDPTYSVHNYKQPNKANYMKKQADARPVVYLEEVKEEGETQQDNSLSSSANYKGMHPSEAKTKKFVASDAPSARPYHLAPASNGNYKQQFGGRPRRREAAQSAESTGPLVNN